MGWTTTGNTRLRDMIADRIDRGASWPVKNTKGEVVQHVKDTRLKHCYRGGRFSGVLWIVWEREVTENSVVVDKHRWIECDLLRYYGNREGWGYKDLTARCGPGASSCPTSYLEMVPPPPDTDTSDGAGYERAWRVRVIARNAEIVAQCKATREARRVASARVGVCV